ncbi:MAG TPA: trypsin-like serine protease [Solirubrobacteraceae bacterium]|nr:trypsin-like serine protease [Solirubrobacteraceae bacterium]
MRRRSALLVPCCAGLLALGPAATSSASPRLRPRIVHGSATPIGDAPFQVALYDPQLVEPGEPGNLLGAQFCGGVIRDATHVVTAAHCITFGGFEAAAPEEVEVLAGSANLEAPEAGSVRDPVLATSFDPEWNPFTGAHDVGVLTLQNPLWSGATPEIDGTATIAPLAFAASQPPAGSAATVSGWGFDKPLLPGQEPSASEEAEGHPAVLQSAPLTIVSQAECAFDYEDEELLLSEFVCANGPSSPVADSCFGDSGGPLFSGAPGSPADRLLGLVDFGEGCAQKEFPGVYQSLADLPNRQFAGSDPPQAPRSVSPPAIAGTLEVGRPVDCEPGGWQGSGLEFRYAFYREESGALGFFSVEALTEASGVPSYTLQSADAGQRLFCVVEARNAGGIGTGISDDVSIPVPASSAAVPTVPVAPAPISPAPKPPTLGLLSRHCGRGSCTVVVRAGDGAGQRLVDKLEAKLSFVRRVRCRKHGRRASCVRRFTRRVGARALAPGRFSIVASGLRPGSYTLAIVAIDSAGLRQTHATKVALVLRPSRRHR